MKRLGRVSQFQGHQLQSSKHTEKQEEGSSSTYCGQKKEAAFYFPRD